MMQVARCSRLRSRLRPAAGHLSGGGGTAADRHQPPPPLGAWSSLVEPILVLVLGHLEGGDMAAARLVSRAWRDAGALVVRRLRFSDKPPDTHSLKQVGASYQCRYSTTRKAAGGGRRCSHGLSLIILPAAAGLLQSFPYLKELALERMKLA
jgi:hypothetical protein